MTQPTKFPEGVTWKIIDPPPYLSHWSFDRDWRTTFASTKPMPNLWVRLWCRVFLGIRWRAIP